MDQTHRKGAKYLASFIQAQETTHTHTQNTHRVHYNEVVDGRPLCRDPNSCSALGADHEQGQGETSGKQTQGLDTHTHTELVTHTHHPHTFTQHIMQMQGHTHTHRRGAKCGKSVVMELRGFLNGGARSHLENDTVCI